MQPSKLILSVLPETMAICQLEKDAPLPAWALEAGFVSLTRTRNELSVVCPRIHVPPGVKHEDGWRCLKVEDTLDFSLTGVIASLTMPLAFEGISVFVISTFDTDYLLVKGKSLPKAVAILSESGHQVKYLQKTDNQEGPRV